MPRRSYWQPTRYWRDSGKAPKSKKQASELHFGQVAEPTAVSFRRSVLQGKESAILDDGWFHSLLRRQVLADFLCCDSGFFVAGLWGRIVYFETHRKVGTFSYAIAFDFQSAAVRRCQSARN